MAGIRKSLLQFVFSGSSMKRWNDKLRPTDFFEIDKQAHKMLVAWVLYELNAEKMDLEDRLSFGQRIIEKGLFDYFFRLVITDIKPSIVDKIRENPRHYKELCQWVLDALEPKVRTLDEGFWLRMQQHFLEPEDTSLEQRILTVAHTFASYWELQVLTPFNSFDDELSGISKSFESKIRSMNDIAGVTELLEGKESTLGRFSMFCGQLRFQVRWSQTPRIPETSVLGHMFVVATYAYFFSLVSGACTHRLVSNFFCGLIHDLPELLTRDIISPVKYSVERLSDLIREYEEMELLEKIFKPLKEGGYEFLVQRLEYFLGMLTGSEFHDIIMENGQTRKVEGFAELHSKYNEDKYLPKDGELIKKCDIIAAFIEAHTSIRNGIISPHLQDACSRIREKERNSTLGNLHIDTLLADFD